MKTTKQILTQSLARAEAVIYEANNSKKKKHGPTIDNFIGQAAAYKQALSLLEMEEIRSPDPVNITKTIVIDMSMAAIMTICLIMALAAVFFGIVLTYW